MLAPPKGGTARVGVWGVMVWLVDGAVSWAPAEQADPRPAAWRPISRRAIVPQFIKLNTLFREAKFQEDHGVTSAQAAKHH